MLMELKEHPEKMGENSEFSVTPKFRDITLYILCLILHYIMTIITDQNIYNKSKRKNGNFSFTTSFSRNINLINERIIIFLFDKMQVFIQQMKVLKKQGDTFHTFHTL